MDDVKNDNCTSDESCPMCKVDNSSIEQLKKVSEQQKSEVKSSGLKSFLKRIFR